MSVSCTNEMSIVKDYCQNCTAQVPPECHPGNPGPVFVPLGCTAHLPESLLTQKSFARDCSVLDFMPGSEMVRNAWMGISMGPGSQVGGQLSFKGVLDH